MRNDTTRHDTTTNIITRTFGPALLGLGLLLAAAGCDETPADTADAAADAQQTDRTRDFERPDALDDLGIGRDVVLPDDSGDAEMIPAELGGRSIDEIAGLDPFQAERGPEVTAYRVGNAHIEIEQLMAAAEMDARPIELSDDGPLYARDGDRHAFEFNDGSGLVFDEDYTRCPVDGPRGCSTALQLQDARVWTAAGATLDEMDAMEHGPMTLREGLIFVERVEATTPAPVHRKVALYRQRIQERPTWGNGCLVAVAVDRDTNVVGIAHAVRDLEPEASGEALAPRRALMNWYDRIEAGEEFSVAPTDIEVEAVDVHSFKLGYHVPGIDADSRTVEPVYRIEATVFGSPADGIRDHAEVVFYEPALAGRKAPGLR